MRENWMLIVALVILVGWASRLLFAGPGIGPTLALTSAGLPIAGILALAWYLSRRRRRRAALGGETRSGGL